MKALSIVVTLGLIVNSLVAHPAQTTASQEKVEAQGALKLGEPQQRTLAPDVIHAWSLALEKGQYAVVEVLQMGIDVVVRIVEPTGAHRGEFDSPTGDSGAEKAAWIANSAGNWKVEIVPLEAKQPGEYEIKLATLREATEKDRQMMEADSLSNLATKLYYSQSKYSEAESLTRRCLILRESLLGPDHSEVAQTLNLLGEICSTLGKYAESESLYQRALAINEKVFGSDHANMALNLNNLATSYMNQLRFAEALPFLKRSLAIREKTFGPEHSEVAQSLSNLAAAYYELGKYNLAEPLFKRSIIIEEKSLGIDHPQLALTLGNLAELYRRQYKFAESEQLSKRALAIREKAFGPYHPDVALGLHNLAALYRYQGKYDEGEPLVKRALEIQIKAFGPDHPMIAPKMINLAYFYAKRGEYAEAESLMLRSREIHEKNKLPVIGTLANLALIYSYQGKYTEAMALEREVLARQEKQWGPKHPNLANTLSKLAEMTFRADNQLMDSALTLVNRAIALYDANTTSDPSWRLSAYAFRARLRKQKNDMEGAFVDLTEALRSAENLRPYIGGGEETLSGFFEKYTDYFTRMVSWQIEVNHIEQAVAYAERSRARVLLDQLATAQIDVRQAIPVEQRAPLEQRETEAKAQIAEFQQRLRLLPSRKDLSNEQKNRKITTLKDSLRTAERDYQQVYEEIKQASPLWHNLITSGGQPVALADIQARLIPANGLMLLYQIGKEGSYLFVIPPSGQKPEAVPLQVPDNLAAALEIAAGPLMSTALQAILVGQGTKESAGGLLQHLSSRRTDAVKLKSTLGKLQALWQVLVPTALWPWVVESAEVIIIPDGVLHLLPFEALVVKAGADPKKTRYWLDEGPAIRYAPSATTLYNIEQRTAARTNSSATQTLALSLSDPIFEPTKVVPALREKKSAQNADNLRPNTEELDSLIVSFLLRKDFEGAGGRLVRLPGTAQETEQIRKAFGQNGIVTLMRQEASESKLRQELPGKRYLHLATHGVVDQQRSALFAALALTPPPGETNVAEDDGWLQLYEIYGLKLPDCELAVLSACETNFGRYFEGEGVFALSRGFLAAGAARVIASHWDVDDKSTAELIGAFFRQIAADEKAGRKIHYAHALREAKRKVRNQDQWSAPYYWAPFVLTGKR